MTTAPLILQQEILKYCVSIVNIELSSYCNRTCAYCPVSFLEGRKDKNDQMTKEMFREIIHSLAEIDYDGQICFSLFNEPLYDRAYVLWALRCVHEELPEASVKIVSNGDYLTADYLDMLCRSHLNELWISVHYEGRWNRDIQLEKMQNILERIGIGLKGQLDESIDSRLVFMVDRSAYNSEHMGVFGLRTEDFMIHGMDRGGVLKNEVAKMENLDCCDGVFSTLNICHDGRVFPCCNLCCSAQELEKYCYGHVSAEGGIFATYCFSTAAAFRRSLFAPRESVNMMPEPCRNCAEASRDNTALYTIDRALRRRVSTYLFKAR